MLTLIKDTFLPPSTPPSIPRFGINPSVCQFLNIPLSMLPDIYFEEYINYTYKITIKTLKRIITLPIYIYVVRI